MNKTALVLALGTLLMPLAAGAQEHVIKIRNAGLGDKAEVKHTDSSETQFKLVDGTGATLQDKKEIKTHKLHFREAGLERAAVGDGLVRLKRQYEHAERTIDGVRNTLPYQGKTLLVFKKDGRFQFEIEGDQIIDGKEAEELNEEFNKGDFRKLFQGPLLPTKAVKVNDTWKFDVGFLAKEFSKDGNIVIDEAKSTGNGKLLKVYEKNGKQFGIMELTLEFPVTHWVHEGNPSPTKAGKFTLRLQRDGCIDGSSQESVSTVSLDAEIQADINANGMDLTLDITLKMSAEDSRREIAK